MLLKMVVTAPHSDKPWTPGCLLVVQGEKENKNKNTNSDGEDSLYQLTQNGIFYHF